MWEFFFLLPLQDSIPFLEDFPSNLTFYSFIYHLRDVFVLLTKKNLTLIFFIILAVMVPLMNAQLVTNACQVCTSGIETGNRSFLVTIGQVDP